MRPVRIPGIYNEELRKAANTSPKGQHAAGGGHKTRRGMDRFAFLNSAFCNVNTRRQAT